MSDPGDRLRAVWSPTHRLASRAAAACAVFVAIVAVAGCGGSSKPAYCTDRTNLENSIKGLTSLNVQSGVSGLQAQLQKIEHNATALVHSAKGDFPSETSAITSSIDQLKTDVQALSSNPSASKIASVASSASSFVNSVKSFTDATKSKC